MPRRPKPAPRICRVCQKEYQPTTSALSCSAACVREWDRQRCKQYYHTHPQKLRNSARDWAKRNRVKKNEYQAEYRARKKLEAEQAKKPVTPRARKIRSKQRSNYEAFEIALQRVLSKSE